ncbi:MAG: polyphenol oxidase family protein [Deltaproteobacteria bacterium]|nr:polyphenol oxidase family protein [Deltaproteobacteria bacterium]
MTERAFLRHPLLVACGVSHGFGVRGAPEPERCLRPRQVHGTAVMRASEGAGVEDADAIVSDVPGLPVAIVTADCVPVLVADPGGAHVAAIHAGWRGLAAGVVEAGLVALQRIGAEPARLRAAVGPHIGPCCYEVDDPVVTALEARFGAAAHAALTRSRPGHAMLDLGALVRAECVGAGLAPGAVATLGAACTRCDAARFHSFRRDGARAGRLLHYVSAGRDPRILDNPMGSP